MDIKRYSGVSKTTFSERMAPSTEGSDKKAVVSNDEAAPWKHCDEQIINICARWRLRLRPYVLVANKYLNNIQVLVSLSVLLSAIKLPLTPSLCPYAEHRRHSFYGSLESRTLACQFHLVDPSLSFLRCKLAYSESRFSPDLPIPELE